MFNALRDWRAERATREGVPPYVIFTNKQLAAMVNARPQSLSKLATIEGIGKTKLENYGQELLAFLARPRSGHQFPPTDSPDLEAQDPAEAPPTVPNAGPGEES